MPRAPFATLLLSAFTVSGLGAQTNPNSVPRAPEAELARFAPFLGRWAVRGPFANIEFVGVTEVQLIAKGWYVEWLNDLYGGGIQRELRMIMGYDRSQSRYRVWRFETTDRNPLMEDGTIRFLGDTLVQQWSGRDQAGKVVMAENRMIVARDSLRMLTFRDDSAGNRQLIGNMAGPRLGTPRP